MKIDRAYGRAPNGHDRTAAPRITPGDMVGPRELAAFRCEFRLSAGQRRCTHTRKTELSTSERVARKLYYSSAESGAKHSPACGACDPYGVRLIRSAWIRRKTRDR